MLQTKQNNTIFNQNNFFNVQVAEIESLNFIVGTLLHQQER